MTCTRLKKPFLFAAAVVVCVVGAGCRLWWEGGVSPPTSAQFPPAHVPHGASATLHVSGDIIEGELLAVETDALVVLIRSSSADLVGKLARFSFDAILVAEFPYAGGYVFNGDRAPPDGTTALTTSLRADNTNLLANRDRLRLLARYPQGIGRELLALLEEAYGAMESLVPSGVR